jgi:hypothetical protein
MGPEVAPIAESDAAGLIVVVGRQLVHNHHSVLDYLDYLAQGARA